MLPVINGKNLLACTEEDLSILLENVDYRENEYIDYKLAFSFLEMKKGNERDTKKIEFKCDVCSFANTDGGYLIFGIRDEKGCASKIEGIEIPQNDTDRFELDRRNDLSGIQPKIPSIQFGFIPLKSGKYVVILYVKHDSFAPYLYLEAEKGYRAYKRNGNGKKPLTYIELGQAFNQSITMDHAILNYRQERIEYYKSLRETFGSSFCHLSIIPDTFIDRSYYENMFVLERTGKISLSSIFSSFNCTSSFIPCVDGLRFLPYEGDVAKAECYVRNNGIVECCYYLDDQLDKNKRYPEGFLPWGWLWNKIDGVCRQFFQVFRPHLHGDRVFICLSIIGCKEVETDDSRFCHEYAGRIDRDEVLCEPVEVTEFDNDDEIGLTIKKLYLSYILSIGVKYNDTLKQLVNELYGV